MNDHVFIPGGKAWLMIAADGRVWADPNLHPDEAAGAVLRAINPLFSAKCAEVERLKEAINRAYLRLQCADVPRDSWHWEVSNMILGATGIGERSENVKEPL